MIAIIKTFESGAGDCIFIVMKDEMDDSSFHIMMDCNVLTNEIKAYIRDELCMRIDVLIATHIDSDHVNGITKLMRNPDFADMQIGMILFNGFQPQTEQPQFHRRCTFLPTYVHFRLDTKAAALMDLHLSLK